jgi:hypothetical protein
VVPQSALWANRAQFQQLGRQVRFTDVGGGNPGPSGGNIMWWNGSNWKPVNGNFLLDGIDTKNDGIANTADQNLNPNAVAVQAGLMRDFDRLRLWPTIIKSGASDTATIRLRYGPTKTAAEPIIATIPALAGANQSYGTILEFKRLSATTLQKQGNADASSNYSGASAGAIPAAVTVANMDSNDMFFSIWAQMTAGTEFASVNDYTLELWASDNS